MVREQLIARAIQQPALLEAMAQVARQAFVPPAERPFAYQDRPLPIGHGQTISQPYVVALMTQLAHLHPSDKVLEVGTGSGYGAAILSQLAREVHTIERLEPLFQKAKATLAHLGYHNVHCHLGDGSLGWSEAAPYDALLVTAGGPQLPKQLLDQLAVGGRLIMPIGLGLNQTLVRATRLSHTSYQTEELEAVRFVPLVGEEGWPSP